jgi:acetyltransferase
MERGYISIHSLDKIFKPESVAIIGTSEKEGSIGFSLVKDMGEAGYQGKIFPVNPRHKFIQGLPAHSSIRKLGEPVDLALLLFPSPRPHQSLKSA